MVDLEEIQYDSWEVVPIELKYEGKLWKQFDSYTDFCAWFNPTWSELHGIVQNLSQHSGKDVIIQADKNRRNIESNLRNNPGWSIRDQMRHLVDLVSSVNTILAPFMGNELNLERLLSYAREYGVLMAAAYWSSYNDWRINSPDQPKCQLGIIYGYFDQKLLSSDEFAKINSMTATEDALRIKNLFIKWYHKQKKTTEKAQCDLADTTNKLQELIDKQVSWRQRFVDVSKRYQSIFAASARSRFDAELRHYREDLALKSPVDYWDTKASDHSRYARRYAIALGLAIGLSFLFVFALSAFLLLPIEESVVKSLYGKEHEYDKINPFVKASAAASVLALVYWTLRIINRNLLSHQHLASDAKERVVMAKTYRAIQSDKDLANDADINIILNALFRPASDGFIKDDYGPAHPVIDLILSRQNK